MQKWNFKTSVNNDLVYFIDFFDAMESMLDLCVEFMETLDEKLFISGDFENIIIYDTSDQTLASLHLVKPGI